MAFPFKQNIGTERWNALQVNQSKEYEWKESSTYIHNPPYFKSLTKELPKINDINEAYVLGFFGDSITTDHISPAGNIAVSSPAGRYLNSKGVEKKDFNSYGARRGEED
jgi:aconitate hydratase